MGNVLQRLQSRNIKSTILHCCCFFLFIYHPCFPDEGTVWQLFEQSNVPRHKIKKGFLTLAQSSTQQTDSQLIPNMQPFISKFLNSRWSCCSQRGHICLVDWLGSSLVQAAPCRIIACNRMASLLLRGVSVVCVSFWICALYWCCRSSLWNCSCTQSLCT